MLSDGYYPDGQRIPAFRDITGASIGVSNLAGLT
jgi:hypothetical protein